MAKRYKKLKKADHIVGGKKKPKRKTYFTIGGNHYGDGALKVDPGRFNKRTRRTKSIAA